MGRMQKTKGKVFERAVATLLRRAFPGRTVRRALQARRPYEPDVVVEGVGVWWECQDAREPSPTAKMRQADRDLAKAVDRGRKEWEGAIAVVVWHRFRERALWATLRLRDLSGVDAHGGQHLVTLELGHFLDVYTGGRRGEEGEGGGEAAA